MRYARDRSEADDLAQEAWMQAFTKIDLYRHEGPFEAWLRRVAVNTCLMELRRRRIQVQELNVEKINAEAASRISVDPAVLDALKTEELMKQIQTMPDGFRQVFNLVAIDGHSHDEAAHMLGITPGTSRSQLTRARLFLQKRLAQLLPVCLP